MISYKDREWCIRSKGRCMNTKCYRYFGPEDADRAMAWWGGPDAPVLFGDMKTNTCGYKPIEDMK